MSDPTIASVTEEMLAYRCPRYQEFPKIPLYRDQVLDCLNGWLQPLCAWPDQVPVTAAMINNYVKLKLVAPPVKKKYAPEQLAQLFCVLLLKQVFSISEIQSLLLIQTRNYPFPLAYDYFCTAFETALQTTFSSRAFERIGSQSEHSTLSALVCSAALCVAQKIFTQKYLMLDQHTPLVWDDADRPSLPAEASDTAAEAEA